ncbi:hypothetical protein BpHYR1_046920 [Brachionus plicatilis]|uniref:Uncharacterized protein n=1 Tax=Brachionus plicatilis TaxID=10195 RepID=A0A3M7SLV9_BRAPC|nr:hypothetical protein BpHYR1_046920 [Brachionus plicatilis]
MIKIGDFSEFWCIDYISLKILLEEIRSFCLRIKFYSELALRVLVKRTVERSDRLKSIYSLYFRRHDNSSRIKHRIMSSPNNEPNITENTTGRSKKFSIKSILDFPYLKSIHFWLKIIIIIFHICGAISVSIKYDNWGPTRYYNFVAITAIVLILIELIFDILWAILIIIASAIVTDMAKNYANMESYAAAAFFGYGAFVFYAIDVELFSNRLQIKILLYRNLLLIVA